MLANIPRSFFVFLLIMIPILFLACAVAMIVFAVIKFRKKYSKTLYWVLPVTIFSIIIMVASWVFNMGLLRFILTMLAVPIVHLIVYFVTNILLIPSIHKYISMKVQNIAFTVTGLLAYLFFPDGSDYGEMYFFFWQIQSDKLSDVAFILSSLALLVHVILLVTQITFSIAKKNNRQN